MGGAGAHPGTDVDYAVPAVRRETRRRPPGGERGNRARSGNDDAMHRAIPPDLSALSEPDTAVLFPSPHPATLVPPPRQVVVLDATWAQARRIIQRIPALRTLPRLALPARALAVVDPIRQSTVAGGLCTLEAMAAALHLLGETEAGRALDVLHAAALDRCWRLRRGAAKSA